MEMIMKLNTFYKELIRINQMSPLTEEAAKGWFLLFHTHELNFQEPFLEDQPFITGSSTWSIEHAALVISSLWPEQAAIQAKEDYWLEVWQPYSSYKYVIDLPPSLREEVLQLRAVLIRDPRIVAVNAADERFMSRHIPARSDRPAQEDVLLAYQERGNSILHAYSGVRLRVNDAEFLGSADDPYLPLSVRDFAPRGMGCLRVAHTYGRAALDLYDYGQHIILKRDGTDMLLYGTGSWAGARIRYDTLYTAWMRFACEIRDVMWTRHPEEQTREWWKLITDEPTSIPYFIESVTYESWFNKWDR